MASYERERMRKAAGRALEHVLGLRPADTVLILTDEATAEVADAFAAAAAERGCPVVQERLPEAARPLTTVPAALAARLAGATILVNALLARPDEVPFRIAWLEAAARTGRIRVGHCPGITTAMLAGGALDIDYAAMRRRADGLHRALVGAVGLRLTSAGGSDLALDVRGRSFLDDLRATEQTACNLPCGELYCAPVEGGADGLLVADGTVSCWGIPPSPLRFLLAGGRAVGLECDDPAWWARIAERLALDEEARVIGELGIGVNPGARLIGNMLEDEKALGTVHLAFGNNLDMPGGRNGSRNHEDYLVLRPTLEVARGDGSRQVVLRDGELLV